MIGQEARQEPQYRFKFLRQESLLGLELVRYEELRQV